ncbi:unnamed protein product [Hydatigera taeniaeformis]|uniref:CG-1 domain-containing protein n=1 Tax=Hydatigena taeniaeformis TaxID=6205 RepID=A0A0R3WQN3_HYDTA|nr:unnamed protein product [Hydatigera taeniaeformis]
MLTVQSNSDYRRSGGYGHHQGNGHYYSSFYGSDSHSGGHDSSGGGYGGNYHHHHHHSGSGGTGGHIGSGGGGGGHGAMDATFVWKLSKLGRISSSRLRFDDDFADRLNYQFSGVLMFLFIGVIGIRQYVGTSQQILTSDSSMSY